MSNHGCEQKCGHAGCDDESIIENDGVYYCTVHWLDRTNKSDSRASRATCNLCGKLNMVWDEHKWYCKKHIPNKPQCDEVVDHPSHYNTGDIEVVDAIMDWHLNFNLGCAVKHVARAGKKDPTKYIEDLGKAIRYLQFEIEWEKKHGTR